MQRVLEAEENGDSFHDDDEFEVDTPKKKNKNRGKVRNRKKKDFQSLFLQRTGYTGLNLCRFEVKNLEVVPLRYSINFVQCTSAWRYHRHAWRLVWCL